MKTFRRVWVYARAYPILALATFGASAFTMSNISASSSS
jgi:hypothetical protein